MFKSNVKSDDVVKFLLDKLGLKPKSGRKRLANVRMTPSLDSDYFIVTTPLGKENEVMKLLEQNPDVDWVQRRDMKSELRCYVGTYISDQMSEISEESDVSDNIWKDRLSELTELMLLLLSDKYESIGNKYPDLKDVIDEKLG